MSTRPLSVLVCVLPGRGHASPTVAVVEGCSASDAWPAQCVDPAFAEKARALAADMAATGGVSALVQTIEDEARSANPC